MDGWMESESPLVFFDEGVAKVGLFGHYVSKTNIVLDATTFLERDSRGPKLIII